MEMCGFFGCHVKAPKGDCPCTECSSCTGLCEICTSWWNLARRNMWTCEAVKEKCDLCRDITGEIQKKKSSII
jgi:hypothetical protein